MTSKQRVFANRGMADAVFSNTEVDGADTCVIVFALSNDQQHFQKLALIQSSQFKDVFFLWL